MPTFDGNQAMFNENAGNIYQALEFRRNYHAMNNGKAGVLRDNDFLCSISTTNIIVAYGSAYINDSLTLAISQYFARTVDDTASTTLAVTPNNTLLARNDLVTLRVLDTARGDASDNCAIVIETGVVVSSFARSLVLASFTVAAGANVATSLIDTRQFAGTYQGVQRCTSTTRPSVPSRGEFIYETNTYKLQQYTTAATSWQPPWNAPWGMLGKVTSTSSSSTTNLPHTTQQDGTNPLTVTLTTITNRNYLVTSQHLSQNTSSRHRFSYVIGGTTRYTFQQMFNTGGEAQTITGNYVFTETSGASKIFKVQMYSGTNVVSTDIGLAGFERLLLIQDIGPSANPA